MSLKNMVIDAIYALLSTVDGKVDTIDGKVDTIDGKVDTIDGKVDTVDTVSDNIYSELGSGSGIPGTTKSVQNVSATFGTTDLTKDVTISEVGSSAVCIYNGVIFDNTGTIDDWEEQNFAFFKVNSTTVRFQRGKTGAYNAICRGVVEDKF